MLTDDRNLSEAERKRLERLERSRSNRRGRTKPSVMPSKLARTSAFVPRKKNLCSDANFVRVYAVEGHSVVEVRGRELGSQHRDAIYALFRLRARRTEVPNPNYNANIREIGLAAQKPCLVMMATDCTWRDLLIATGRTQHVNNLMTLLDVMEQVRQVTFRVYQGTYDQYEKAKKQGRLAGPGFSDNLLGLVEWDGVKLDSKVRIQYGEWVKRMFEAKHLVSVNADVYFRLSSDYAKTFWPFVDSQPNYTYIDEDKLAELAGRDPATETVKQRVKFREEVRQAFNDMVKAGGLASWTVEVSGAGRVKRYRYMYQHALPRAADVQLSLFGEDSSSDVTEISCEVSDPGFQAAQ